MPTSFQASLRHAIYYEIIAHRAEELFLRGGDALKRALSLFDLNWHNIDQGYFWAAMHWQKNPDIAKLCSDYLNAAPYCLDRRLTTQQRITWLETALAAARSINNRVAVGRHQGDLGLCYHEIGEYQKALQFHERRLIIARETGDRRGESVALNNLGNSYRSLALLESPYVQTLSSYSSTGRYIWYALENHKQALFISREVGDHLEECAAWRNLGRTCMALALYGRAMKYLEHSLLIAREIKSYSEQSYVLVNLGTASKFMGRYRRSVKFYEQALAIQDELGNLPEKGRVLNSLGAVYKWMRDHRAAISCYEHKLALARQIGRPEQEAASYYSLGAEYWELGDLRRTIDYYQHAIDTYQELHNYSKEADVQVSLGHAYLRAKEKVNATEAFARAETVFRKGQLPMPITLVFGKRMLSIRPVLLPLIYALLKFLGVFFWLNPLIAKLTLRSGSRDKELNETLTQLDNIIQQDSHHPKINWMKS